MLVYSKIKLNLLIFIIFGFSAVAEGEYIYNLFGVPGQGYVIEVIIGKPAQTLNVLIDTGSTNFAIAAAPDPNIENYFHKEKSSSLISLTLNVSVLYTQGSWAGQLATDEIYFPTLNSVPKVNCSIAFIMESNNFYMNGSGWQGILGLAYPAISRPNPEIGSWIDYLQRSNNDRTMAFSLTLCGTNDGTKHHGSFEILNNVAYAHEFDGLINIPVLKEWFYEVVIVGIRIDNIPLPIDCKEYNTDKTIVDSGTTNLRLPNAIFGMIVNEIIALARLNDIIVDNNFWMQNNVSCWSERVNWEVLPKISIELAKSKNEYTALELPGTSYIRQVASNPTDAAKYCYKFGIEASGTGTILGVVAMEGFQVVFNRTARTVGFRKSACGPNVFIRRPVFSEISDINFFALCSHVHMPGTSMLEIAAYIVCAVLVLAVGMFGYILVQWFKDRYLRGDRGGASVTLSHASLINEDSS